MHGRTHVQGPSHPYGAREIPSMIPFGGATNIQYPERIYHYQRADAIIATPRVGVGIGIGTRASAMPEVDGAS
jgi:hypothetical protein